MVSSTIVFALTILAAVSAAPQSRIVGGSPISIQEFPYIASVIYTYPGPGVTIQRCVGAIVSSFHVLTSAYCFLGANTNNVIIQAGSSFSLTGGIQVSVSDVVLNPTYEAEPRTADIAVVFVGQPLSISGVIGNLMLPYVDFPIADETPVQVVSWGFVADGGTQLDQMNSVIFNKVNTEQCMHEYLDVANEVEINNNVICAAAPGRGTCLGDSGAPMTIDEVLVGLHSFHRSCDDTYSSVFTRVDQFTNWIIEVAVAPGRSAAPGIINTPVVAQSS